MGRWGVTTPVGPIAARCHVTYSFDDAELWTDSCVADLAAVLLSFCGRALTCAARETSMKSRKYEQPRRRDIHVAPPKYAERQQARPGAGIKRARAVMPKKPRSS
jgi:hypothetical protein